MSEGFACLLEVQKLAPHTKLIILLGAGKTEQALGLLQGAARALADDAEVQYQDAAALAKPGDEAAALRVLRKALANQLPEEAKNGAQKLLEELSR